MTDKRNHRRFGPLVIKASLTAGSDPSQGYLTNLSEGGAFLAVDDPPPLGTVVAIRAILPWGLGELRATARVAWRSPRGRLSGVGLAFEALDPEARAGLEAYLDKFTELAARIEEMEEG